MRAMRWCARAARTGLVSVAAAALLVAGCAGTGGTSGGGSGRSDLGRPEVGSVEPGAPVSGEVAVTWRNLDPRNAPVSQTLVNESSEAGRQLRSGKVTSTEVRVIADADMGTLLAKLEDRGFFEHATRGMGLDNIPNVPGRRGIVVVHRDGTDWGLMLTPGSGGTAIPATYRDCKALVFAVHSAVQGLEVQVNVDADRVFSAPPIKMPRR